MQAFTEHLSVLLSRCRVPGAFVFAVLSFFCLWTGFGLAERIPLSRMAIADSVPAAFPGGLPDSLVPDQAELLQSTVDSLALSMSGVLTSEPFSGDESHRRRALAAALRALTFKLGGEVYFTAWNGTQALYSPLSPDAADMDFAESLDANGSAFVQRMERIALEGGGFLQVNLARQLPPSSGHFFDSPTHFVPENQAPVVRAHVADVEEGLAEVLGSRPQVCPLGGHDTCGVSQRRPDKSAEAVEQVVYVRRIPELEWHIAAFMPADARPAEQGFSRLWSRNRQARARQAAEDLFRKGLCVSGLSLAGLAGLMLTPGRRRDEDEPVSQNNRWWEECLEQQANDPAVPDPGSDRPA